MRSGGLFKYLGATVFLAATSIAGIVAYPAMYDREFLSPHYTKEVRGADFKRLVQQSISLGSSIADARAHLRRRGFQCEDQTEDVPRKEWETAKKPQRKRLYCVYGQKSRYEYRSWSIVIDYDTAKRVVEVDGTTGAIVM